MCLCRQPPVHIYNSDYSFLGNISQILDGSVREWLRILAGEPPPSSRFGFVDCPCSDDYATSAFLGIIDNSGHLIIALSFVVLMILAPVGLGLAKRVGARRVRYLIAAWLAMVMWSFGWGFANRIDRNWAADALPHMPLQLVFNVSYLSLLPALAIFAVDRGVAFFQRRFTR